MVLFIGKNRVINLTTINNSLREGVNSCFWSIIDRWSSCSNV